MRTENTMNGTLKTIRADKGFGFILGEDGKEYFVHRSAFSRDVYSRICARGSR